ncbi:serine/threonine-protein kinase [Actinocorallia sp. A-T 12471]|uniref:serine/threonine-protein kinase n=1 Tax=Actinocorallia sp. A-T 12471 TaxID=3089813 RepID=UPI0029D1C436|nr:serine/threonine-protein kinase [Actinocorallia sp. A-T 12471]MDX6743160.1 serine/threonine-protein kinase [Actinocorallia sp. A-T 12471]
MSLQHEVPLRPEDPRRIGPYALSGRLGEGGQGVVYLGRDREGRAVAVKVLKGGPVASPKARGRFIKEAGAASRVEAPQVARVLDAKVTAERPYIVSEYVRGRTLQDEVAEAGPLKGPELHKIALRTAVGLAAIHRAQVVHRDLKPSNVVLGPRGAKVIDFGVARLLDGRTPQTNHPVGTPAYMSPEQVEDLHVGPESDVFAWGSTVVYAATGRPPFGTGPTGAVMRRITDREPDLGALRGGLRGLVARCLDKEPAARPTAAEIVRFLRAEARPKAKAAPKRVPRYRSRMIIALVIVSVLGFTCGVLI